MVKLAKILRDQALADAQDVATAVLYAEAKFGELLKPLTEHHEARSGSGTSSLPEGITKKQSHFAQTLADNIDTIEEVIEEAKEKEEIPTRYDVLKEFYLLTTMIK